MLRDILLTDDADKTLDEDDDESGNLPADTQQQQQQQQQQLMLHQQQPAARVVQGGLAGISGKQTPLLFIYLFVYLLFIIYLFI